MAASWVALKPKKGRHAATPKPKVLAKLADEVAAINTSVLIVATPSWWKCRIKFMKEQLIGFVEAKDTDGQLWRYDVYLRQMEPGKPLVLAFGYGPISYYLKSLLRDFPRTTGLCIDGEGRNHGGRPVYVNCVDINEMMLRALQFASPAQIRGEVPLDISDLQRTINECCGEPGEKEEGQ